MPGCDVRSSDSVQPVHSWKCSQITDGFTPLTAASTTLPAAAPVSPTAAAAAETMRTTNTRRAQRFARQLQARFHLPVHEVDERYTTVEARAGGARDLDAAAAAIILEQFLAGVPG